MKTFARKPRNFIKCNVLKSQTLHLNAVRNIVFYYREYNKC